MLARLVAASGELRAQHWDGDVALGGGDLLLRARPTQGTASLGVDHQQRLSVCTFLVDSRARAAKQCKGSAGEGTEYKGQHCEWTLTTPELGSSTGDQHILEAAE